MFQVGPRVPADDLLKRAAGAVDFFEFHRHSGDFAGGVAPLEAMHGCYGEAASTKESIDLVERPATDDCNRAIRGRFEPAQELMNRRRDEYSGWIERKVEKRAIQIQEHGGILRPDWRHISFHGVRRGCKIYKYFQNPMYRFRQMPKENARPHQEAGPEDRTPMMGRLSRRPTEFSKPDRRFAPGLLSENPLSD
jgi:hypothetical protein